MPPPEDTVNETTMPNMAKSYKRPGKLNVDYDEYGEELAPTARVWKKYVEETNEMDGEFVDGWNKTLDVILVFAALFSAISTAFVIESSKDLKPDYTEQSAQTLLVVSQTLLAISTGSPSNVSAQFSADPASFTPAHSAVVVNLLWFTSLSLSVAVSLIAILAKEWCHAFMAGRVGTMLRQGRLRQQRWDGIERWGMKEILHVLPLLMHAALLLFAVGLSVYLWNINRYVALPVVFTTVFAVLFYAVTALLSLIFQFCPYTTAPARLFYSCWLGIIRNRHIKNLIGIFIALVTWLLVVPQRIRSAWTSRSQNQSFDANDIESRQDADTGSHPSRFHNHLEAAQKRLSQWVERFPRTFSTDRSQLVERETLMDDMTSSMLSWMISNCEDSRSVDLALQALAGAELGLLPRQALWECGAVQLVSQRLKASLDVLRHPHTAHKLGQNKLLDNAALYLRSLYFLVTLVHNEGFEIKIHLSPNDGVFFKNNNTSTDRLDVDAGDAYHCLMWSNIILDSSWGEEWAARRPEIAAFILNSIPPAVDMKTWEFFDEDRGQCEKQWELLRGITTGQITDISSNAAVALVNGIAKTYLYNPAQSPALLVDMLKMPSTKAKLDLRHAIGLALTIAAFANHDYPRGDNNSDQNTCLTRAKKVYDELFMREVVAWRTESLLSFGLFGVLAKPTQYNDQELTATQLKSVVSLSTVRFAASYDNLIPTLPADFGGDQHAAHVVSDWLDSTSREPDYTSVPHSVAIRYLDALLSPLFCRSFSDAIMLPLIGHFSRTESLELKKLCLRGLQRSLGTYIWATDAAPSRLAKTNFLVQLLELTTSTSEDIIPYSMHFLWVTTCILLDHFSSSNCPETRHPAVTSLLQSLRDVSIADSAGTGFPRNIGDMGFMELWVTRLVDMCHNDLQNVLDSEILKDMISFYEEAGQHIIPRTTELPAPFDNTWTWLEILKHLEGGCTATVGSRTRAEESGQEVPRHKLEGECHGCGAGECNGGTSKNLYWAM